MSEPAAAAPRGFAGRWLLVHAEMAGAAAPDLLAGRIILEFTPGRYTVRFGGATADAGSWEPGAAEGELLLRGERGANQGREIPALWRLVGAELEICYGFAGERPTTFATRPGIPWYLARYRRPPA